MLKNIGPVDRVVRLAIGFVLIAYAIPLRICVYWLGWLGVVPVLTAAVGFCRRYRLLGISTCAAKRVT